MSFFLHGVHVPHRKNTANISPERMTDVKTVILPVSMHIGAPAKPVVIEQGLQPTHFLVVRLGHILFSIERPFSTIKMLISGFLASNS